MAKNLKELPPQFRELVDVLDGADPVGWEIGSAEGGWATPSEEDWGKQVVDEQPESAPGKRAERAVKVKKQAAG